MRRRRQTADRLVLAEVTSLHGPEDGVELVHLELAHVELTQAIMGKGLELVHGFSQPLQHRVGIDFEHPCGSAHPQSFGSAGQHADTQLHCCLLAMKNRAMVLRKIAVARGAVKLSPGTTTGMAVGPQVIQTSPPAIVTSGVGTKCL